MRESKKIHLPLDKEYSSADGLLDRKGVEELLQKMKLMPEDVIHDESELLR
jgi:hypothetical protein